MAGKPAPTLRPEDEISHYRILGPLGAGGMGEVYLAQDLTLERNVAIKVLPPDLVRSEERVRRFVQEAKSASSLSHPNIVTIHEIGQEAVRTVGAADSSPVHFISMELVNGKTIAALIHEDHTDPRTMVGWLAQAADGIAKAHAAGIVHRDLKPGNVMVTSDGFAKVLDFGLAKLTERSAAATDSRGAPTVTHAHTGEGVVLGTAGYMSPEQVRGASVDARSDIFSFGCILYESVTRRRAFAADSSIETMHNVLNETPAPVEDLAPGAPAELRRLIRRCLHKSPDQRLQSMKDLALELREIASDYDSLSASASGSSSTPSAARVVAAAPKKRAPVLWIIAGVAVVAVAALVGWGLWGGRSDFEAFQTMRMSTLTSSGDVADAALSPDGRYLAYVSEKAGRRSLTVRQVATGSAVVIVPPGEAGLANPSFSPDGNYLFYTSPRPDRLSYWTLYQVPSLGGRPSEIAFDVDSRSSFSPDGKSLVFKRRSTGNNDRLIVLDVGTRQERILAEVADPDIFLGAPSWSPDGRQVAACIGDAARTLQSTVALFDARDGGRQDWLELPRTVATSLTWVHGGAALAMSGQYLRTSTHRQVALVSYPGGRWSRATNDFYEYSNVSASFSDPSLAAVRESRTSFLHLVDADGPSARRLTTASGPESSFSQSTVSNTGMILCRSPRNGVQQIWAIGTNGEEPVPLTDTQAHAFRPKGAAGTIVYDRLDSTGIQVWAMSATGGSPRQLTQGPRSQVLDLSRDGRHVLVEREVAGKAAVLATADGRVERDLGRISDAAGAALFSPDSASVLLGHNEGDSQGLDRVVFELSSIEGGEVTATVRPSANATDFQWSPDGGSITYLDRSDPSWNVFRSSLTVGAAPAPVTFFTAGRVVKHAWSPDARRLGLLVRNGEQVDLWVTDAAGRTPVRVAQIAPETATALSWMPDNRHLVVEASTRSSDVVLIRDFF